MSSMSHTSMTRVSDAKPAMAGSRYLTAMMQAYATEIHTMKLNVSLPPHCGPLLLADAIVYLATIEKPV